MNPSLPTPPNPKMPNKPRNLNDALAALTDLQERIKFYSIGTEEESATVPGALVVDSLRLNALKLLVDYASAKFVYVALNGYGWGKSTNPMMAVANCKANNPKGPVRGPGGADRLKVKLYRVHEDTKVFGDGSWEYPQGFEPELLNP